MITKFNMKGTATPINDHGFFCGLTVNIELSTDTELLRELMSMSVEISDLYYTRTYLYTYSKPIDPEKIHDQ